MLLSQWPLTPANPCRMIQGLLVRKVRSHPRQRHYSGMFCGYNHGHVGPDANLQRHRSAQSDDATPVASRRITPAISRPFL